MTSEKDKKKNIHKLFAFAKITNEYSLLISGVVSVCVWVWLRTLVCAAWLGISLCGHRLLGRCRFWFIHTLSLSFSITVHRYIWLLQGDNCGNISDDSKQFHSLSCGLDERCCP